MDISILNKSLIKNLVTFLFVFFSYLIYSQPDNSTKPLNRLLYENYFRQLYMYDPALIRENNISSLEINWSYKYKETLMSSRTIRKIFFRKDGRPIQAIELKNLNGHEDSIVMNYSYDSLGNLTNYLATNYKGYYPHTRTIKEKSFLEFYYTDNRLTKTYGQKTQPEVNGTYIYFNGYDTLNYDLNDKKVAIYRINSKGFDFLYTPKPNFNFSEDTNHIYEYSYNEIENTEKPIDKEILWIPKSDLKNPTLQELQKYTRIQHFTNENVNEFKNAKLVFGNYDTITKISLSNTIYKIICIDTLNNQIYLADEIFNSKPTSLEDEITHIKSISHYNFALQLLKTQSTIRRSRGENINYSTGEYFCSYFKFDLIKKKENRTYESDHIFIFEENTTIKNW